MATYAFETITAAQAAAFTNADQLTFATLGRNRTTVLFNPASAEFPQGSVSIVDGARTVVFGPGIIGTTQFEGGSLYGAVLVIGAALDDAVAMGSVVGGPQRPGSALYGGPGNDRFFAANGDDLLQGNTGDDRLIGWDGNDTVYGGQDNDGLSGDAGEDFLQGNRGDDTGFGGDGSDTVLGGQGGDVLFGGAGKDFLNGNLGNDTLAGDGPVAGNLRDDNGFMSADTLSGEAGDDVIESAGAADVLLGGDGVDRFRIISNGDAPAYASAPQIRDWAGDEQIQFQSGFTVPPAYVELIAQDFAAAVSVAQAHLQGVDNAVVAVQVGGDVVVFSGSKAGSTIDATVVLVGRGLADISAANFVL